MPALAAMAAMAVVLPSATTSCKRNQEAPAEAVIRPVRYQQVFAVGGSRVRSFAGAAKAGAEIKLSFKVAGTVRALNAKVGDRVAAGQRIAELDPRDYQLQVEDVEASLAQARAQSRNAAADYERVRGLYENNNASKADLDAARTAADSAEALVSSVRKKLELAKLQLSYTMLASPVDGAVAETPSEVNENVSQGQAIVVLNAGGRPEVEVAIPESLITQVRQGSQVTVRFDSFEARAYRAVVTEVGVAPTRSATTFPVTVRLSQDDARVLPGMTAEVSFRFGSGSGAARLIVPPQAVGEDRDGRYVFTVERTQEGLGVVRRRPVEVGEMVSEGLEIRKGLSDGDTVVTAGVNQIQDGQQVRLLDSWRG